MMDSILEPPIFHQYILLISLFYFDMKQISEFIGGISIINIGDMALVLRRNFHYFVEFRIFHFPIFKIMKAK